MLPFPSTFNIKLLGVGLLAALVAMVVVGQRIKLAAAKNEIAELQSAMIGCQTAVEVQAMAAKADSERLNAMASEAANAARNTLTRGRQEKRASVVPGAGSAEMNKWLDVAIPSQ